MSISKLSLNFKNKTNPPTTTDPTMNATNMNEIINKINELIDFANPIISSGKNDNGYWVRFFEGTQICYRNVDITDAEFHDYHGKYGFTLSPKPFPMPFIEPPVLLAGTNNITNQYHYFYFYGTFGTTATSTGEIGFMRDVETTTTKVNVKWWAIGRWKN